MSMLSPCFTARFSQFYPSRYFAKKTHVRLFLSMTGIGFLLLTGCVNHQVNEPTEKVTYINGIPSYYIVKKGETLSLIASRYRLDYRKVAALNGLDSNYTVYTGQKLRLSGITPARRTTQLRSLKSSTAYRPAASVAGYTPTAVPPVTATQKTWINPVSGSIFKTFNPATGVKGTWYKASVGSSVVASQSGTVLYAGNKLSEYGNLIMIRHDSDFVTVYAHLDSIRVQEGQTVQVGQAIGTVGTVDGQPVIEFQIRYRGTPVNPVSFLK